MSSTGRAFVAVVPPVAVLERIESATASVTHLVPGARWTTQAQRHVTLQFLGNRVDLDAVAGALGGLAVAGGEVRLRGGGAFPGERRGTVLWAGVREGADVLTRLAGAVGALLAPLGHEPDGHRFHPHLTLARFRSPTDLRAAIDVVDGHDLGPGWRVDEVVLFRSETRPEGARYEVVARVPAAAGA